MAIHSSSSFGFFLANGYDLKASKIQAIDFERESITEMTHGLGDTAEEVTPVGISKYTLAQQGAFFNDAANGAHDLLKTGAITNRVISFSLAGNTVGAPFYGCLGSFTIAYTVILSNGALHRANPKYVMSGHCQEGVIVQPWAVKAADWNTKTLGTPVDYALDLSQTVIPITAATAAVAAVVTTPVPHGLVTGQVVVIAGNTFAGPAINGEQIVTVLSTTTFSVPVDTTGSSGAGTGGTLVLGSTVNGGVAFQQVSAFAGFTGYVGKVQQSADDITYADLATFANVTSGPDGQAVTVAAGTTIERYLAFDGNVTGSGSITVFGGFARG